MKNKIKKSDHWSCRSAPNQYLLPITLTLEEIQLSYSIDDVRELIDTYAQECGDFGCMDIKKRQAPTPPTKWLLRSRDGFQGGQATIESEAENRSSYS